ncbi:ABC transporter ATP-binding protein [Henriciella mobilis]|uniref:ABC transporter ATP-binding protein n=1 Tax=Henriciella mobilis TaxID=2305467 RepID=UPI000E67136A|nr:ABC transporter ATP-binding protein [Henriciella mobilis]RIJ17358.1 ABC transporter ATP-binding protein [Henriciella mobilis]RIJ25653.1 ABC transporter ATP-binding protein [Henriciella mobilis]
MTQIKLENVTLTFPTAAKARRVGEAETANRESRRVAGQIDRDKRNRLSVSALRSVSLELNDGDRFGIIGSNGSGKTTLLRVMGGIYTPQKGRVLTKGRIATMFSMGIGMNAEATGLQNIYLSGLMAGANRRQIKQVVPEIIEFTELGDYVHLPIRTYSQGMAMRLKFACATAFRPDIVLLDEWIGAGDEDFQEKAQVRINELLEKAGIIVIASHNLQLIRSVATKVIWLERGEVRMIGETQTVLDARAAERKRLAEENDGDDYVEEPTLHNLTTVRSAAN